MLPVSFLRALGLYPLTACVLLWGAVARAECTMDSECKGDRICSEGQCVVPGALPAAPAAPAPSAVSAPAPAPAATTPSPAPAPPTSPPMVRHSKGMMISGIVLVSLTPVALAVAAFTGLAQALCKIDNDRPSNCDRSDPLIYGSLLSAAAFVGAGIPLIVIGAHKEPASAATARVTVSPWAGQRAGGVALRVEM